MVFGVDSWAELKHPDMTASVTNPFLSIFPRTPLPRIFNTLGDIEVIALVAAKMAELTGDERFNDYWKFVREDSTDVYLQRDPRLLDQHQGLPSSPTWKRRPWQGVPALMNSRTIPKAVGYEQVTDSRPWYTKSGPAGVLPRGGRVHRSGREPAGAPRARGLDVLRAERDRGPDARGPAAVPGPRMYGVKLDDLSCERPLRPQRGQDLGRDRKPRRTR